MPTEQVEYKPSEEIKLSSGFFIYFEINIKGGYRNEIYFK